MSGSQAAPTTTDAVVTVSPAENLRDRQRVHVNVRGFGAEAKVRFSECASVRATNPAGCGDQPAAQPVTITDGHGASAMTFVVSAIASSLPADPTQTHPCTSGCVLVATDGDRLAIHALSFSGTIGPTPAQVADAMARTVEVAYPSEHFAPGGEPVTTTDGRRGFITAVVGIRSPTADAKGQLVFFWHNQTFIGWSSDHETISITRVGGSGPGAFAVTYANFGPRDAICCASLEAVPVTYRWNGRSFTPNVAPPPGVFGLKGPAAGGTFVRLISNRTIASDAPCGAVQLRLAMARDLGSLMAQAGAFFSLTNHSSAPCVVEGYPRIALYDTSGTQMPIRLDNGGMYQVNDPGVHPVTIPPGASVYFGLGWLPYRFNPSKGMDGYIGCVHLGRVTVTDDNVKLSNLATVSLPFCPPWGAKVTAIASADVFTIASPLGPNV